MFLVTMSALHLDKRIFKHFFLYLNNSFQDDEIIQIQRHKSSSKLFRAEMGKLLSNFD